eukprot:CAMPEP_0117526076 /NCGR_PEP_ID=MMETSP0784-20121206/36100_1 /TAXON_ID=39447 /ORGANISM="" /LENGTH=176 /DNA_ID=CAMNT_0005322295 /DNA_START=41 /DNA_END=572 /DNA_ORIENTATION=+
MTAQPHGRTVPPGGNPYATQGGMATANYATDRDKAKPKQTWFDWLTGKQPPKSPAELRVDRYVMNIVALDRCFASWESQAIDKTAALQQCEYYMKNIMEIGRVDGELARTELVKKGIDDQRRMDLEREYQDLQKANGKQVQNFGVQAKYAQAGKKLGTGNGTSAAESGVNFDVAKM